MLAIAWVPSSNLISCSVYNIDVINTKSAATKQITDNCITFKPTVSLPAKFIHIIRILSLYNPTQWRDNRPVVFTLHCTVCIIHTIISYNPTPPYTKITFGEFYSLFTKWSFYRFLLLNTYIYTNNNIIQYIESDTFCNCWTCASGNMCKNTNILSWIFSKDW